MNQVHDFSETGPVSEMAIVDTFTKLIFGQEDHYSAREEAIIRAFRLADASVALDSRQDMGQYLRAMGVKEMIQLVSRVQAQLTGGIQVLPADVESVILNRRAH